MSEQGKSGLEGALRTTGESGIDAERRAILTLAGGGLAGALLGLDPTPARATSGIGFVGQAQAQAATDTPAGPKWWPSRWGADDQAGASNWITPEKILDAAKLIKTGKTYELGRIYESTMPKFGDRAFALRIPGSPTGGPLGNNRVIWYDEFLATEIGQVGTQFDGLGHIGVAIKGEDKAEMRFYNGMPASEVGSGYGLKKLGMEHVKPIFTRGLVLDMVAVKGRNLNLGEEITPADIEAALKAQGVAADWLKPGDAIFFHTGWGSLWNTDNAQYGKGEPGLGVAAGQWCIGKQVCVVGADNWAVEVVPNPNANLAFPVHQDLLTKNGIFIHENMDLSTLVSDRAWQFIYVMLPLRIKGATGSPGRPIAIV